mgnify:CR=1 FL=1
MFEYCYNRAGIEDTNPMKYLGMNISEVDGEIYFISQDSYVDSGKEIEIKNKTDKSRVLNAEEQASCRRLCGQLNWISTCATSTKHCI